MEEKRELTRDEMGKVTGGTDASETDFEDRWMYKNPIPCPFCSDVFYDSMDLGNHIRSSHQDMI